MSQKHFADRLADRITETRSILVMGLDPRPGWLPGELRSAPDAPVSEIAGSVREFDRQLIRIASDRVPAVKIQIAFYEALGTPGIQTFLNTVELARDAGLLVLVDAKRGDIGTTARAYANAYLGPVDGEEADPPLTQGGPFFPGDAMTINPLFGSDGLQPFLDAAEEHGKGLFALVKTSNPGAADIQDLTAGGRPVYEHIARTINDLDEQKNGNCGYTSTGAVVGATQSEALQRIRSVLTSHFLLTPGVGAQGGDPENVSGLVDDHGLGLLVPMSRSLIYAFRERKEENHWKQAVAEQVEHWNERLREVLQLP